MRRTVIKPSLNLWLKPQQEKLSRCRRIMTAKWLSLTPNPPRIPIFYTLTKIHKPTPYGRPIISGCDGPTERISAFVDRLIQPIAQKQDSYLKDTTDFLNFIDK